MTHGIKTTWEEKKYIYELHQRGATVQELCNKFALTQAAVRLILRWVKTKRGWAR